MMAAIFSAMQGIVNENNAYTVLSDIGVVVYLDQFLMSDSWIEVGGIRITHNDLLFILLDKRELLLTQKYELSGKVKPLNISLFYSTPSGPKQQTIEFLLFKDWYVFSKLVVLLLLPLRTLASLDAEQIRLVEDLSYS